MKTVHLKQNWKGFFTYLEAYDTSQQYQKVEFTLEITLSENSFIGISYDLESKDAFNKPATVKGFIEDDKISFVMKYPCYYYKDEKGNIILDPSSEHPDIHYLGFLDENKKYVNGNWEMTVYEEKYADGYLEDIINGEFEMWKVN
ncbi:hypothetical protein [Psychroserpens sp. SPM9]|uniref:hypothetical protein n=1 Tax=Psychroserpens sp. SPM9 TaxID=2975598 RepID=UPI0021A56348|nr:hypothetical protein [Psychroserpens sp. SPM9]MDG5493014.1 hypothetical protein [Psychroserpens sp. SPM9]